MQSLGKKKILQQHRILWKNINFESCLQVILKAMDKALLCDSDEEFPKEYKKLLEHKKKLDEQNAFYEKSYRNTPKVNNSYLADD